MNPFDLRGPQFLVFFTILSAVVFALVWWLTSPRRRGFGRVGRLPIHDPLQIAHLRGGAGEVVSVVVASLLDRGFLSTDAVGRLLSAPKDRSSLRAIEKAVLDACRTPKTIDGCRVDTAVRAQCAEVERQLADAGFSPTAPNRLGALMVIGGGTLGLLVVGIVKVVIAHQRGRSNTGILFALLAIDVSMGVWLVRTLHARVARQVIGSIRVLFSDLRRRAVRLKRGESPVDVEFFVAVFGLGPLPRTLCPERDHLTPRPAVSDPAVIGGCSTIDVSGCGGGGDGGGGGCGGCGS